jgi:hypothetical protein
MSTPTFIDATPKVYGIQARTSTRMDGTFDIISIEAETYTSWAEATCRAMELEYAARHQRHNGRTIQYDVF